MISVFYKSTHRHFILTCITLFTHTLLFSQQPQPKSEAPPLTETLEHFNAWIDASNIPYKSCVHGDVHAFALLYNMYEKLTSAEFSEHDVTAVRSVIKRLIEEKKDYPLAGQLAEHLVVGLYQQHDYAVAARHGKEIVETLIHQAQETPSLTTANYTLKSADAVACMVLQIIAENLNAPESAANFGKYIAEKMLNQQLARPLIIEQTVALLKNLNERLIARSLTQRTITWFNHELESIIKTPPTTTCLLFLTHTRELCNGFNERIISLAALEEPDEALSYARHITDFIINTLHPVIPEVVEKHSDTLKERHNQALNALKKQIDTTAPSPTLPPEPTRIAHHAKEATTPEELASWYQEEIIGAATLIGIQTIALLKDFGKNEAARSYTKLLAHHLTVTGYADIASHLLHIINISDSE